MTTLFVVDFNEYVFKKFILNSYWQFSVSDENKSWN